MRVMTQLCQDIMALYIGVGQNWEPLINLQATLHMLPSGAKLCGENAHRRALRHAASTSRRWSRGALRRSCPPSSAAPAARPRPPRAPPD